MLSFFFFNDTATTEIYTLSLHDALPISRRRSTATWTSGLGIAIDIFTSVSDGSRSEEHTSELQSHSDLVCRLLLEKKKKKSTRDRILTTQMYCASSNRRVGFYSQIV